MTKITVKKQVTHNGLTYLPGTYEVVGNNIVAGGNQVNEREAGELKANHPVLVADWVAPKPKPKRVTKKATPKK
jgi:hypothetical protein